MRFRLRKAGGLFGMAWPLASQFSAMLQRPAVAFRDPALRQYAIERDRFRQPRPGPARSPWSTRGFRRTAEGRWPSACSPPSRPSGGSATTPSATTSRPGGPPAWSISNTATRASAPRATAAGSRLILMDWVEGETLFQWVRGPGARSGTRGRLAAAAGAVARRGGRAGGRANRPRRSPARQRDGHARRPADAGRLRRDVRAGAGRPAQPGGRGSSRTSTRTATRTTLFSLDLDRFSAMVIYVALRALAADPGLWQQHVEARHYDKLLFRSEDFRAPGSSRLVAELTGSPDAEVRDLTEAAPGAAAAPHGARSRRWRQLAESFVPADREAACGRAVGGGGGAAEPPRPLPRRAAAPEAADPPGLRARLPAAVLGRFPEGAATRSARRATGAW